MLIFFAVIVVCLWIGAAGWLLFQMLDAFTDDYEPRVKVVRASAFILFLAFTGGFISLTAVGDPNAKRLCRSGHEEWVTEHSWLLVGKVLVPTTTTSKKWFCERWEGQ